MNNYDHADNSFGLQLQTKMSFLQRGGRTQVESGEELRVEPLLISNWAIPASAGDFGMFPIGACSSGVSDSISATF